MYTALQEKSFYTWAKDALSRQIQLEEIDDLRNAIRYFEWTYYVRDNPILADAEYDQLFNVLKELETKFPASIQKDSPTQRVAKGLNSDFPNVTHLVPMLSLENTYNAEDLMDWDRKCREHSQTEQIEYCVEPKFDGASISLVYENNQLARGATRGDGVQGDEITRNLKQIKSIPLSAELEINGIQQIEIRGEALIDKQTFAMLNNRLVAEHIAPLANPRNAASGSLRMKDPNEMAKRGLNVYLYHVSYFTRNENVSKDNEILTHVDMLKTLERLGFKTSMPHIATFSSIQDVIQYCTEYEQKRDALAYEIDGMVIKVNRLDLQDKIGQTSHHPRWAVAYKFKARQASSKLLQIDYQVGRTGSITPVAKIEPVSVGGVTISSISLFNEDVIKEKNLMLGDTILIERAGDVIPYIVKSFPELRDGSEQPITFPRVCPVCKDSLFKPEEEAVWRCTNLECEAQIIERIIHFASKDAMDIRGLGDALVRRFYEVGALKAIDQIYTLPFETLQALEGFGEKSILNLQEAIEKSKKQPLHRLLFALGIRYVGETTAKTLARNIGDIHDLFSKSMEDLCALEDVGVKVAASIVDFFAHAGNRALLDRLSKLGVQTKNNLQQSMQQGGWSGKSFLFTGTLQMKRSEAEALVENKGGSILGSVSSKLHYLVVGEDAGSKLEKAKKLGTIRIINEDEFLQMLNASD